MPGIDSKYILGIMDKLQYSEAELLKYILGDSFKGKIH